MAGGATAGCNVASVFRYRLVASQSTAWHLTEPRSWCGWSLLCQYAKSTHPALLSCSSWKHCFGEVLRNVILSLQSPQVATMASKG